MKYPLDIIYEKMTKKVLIDNLKNGHEFEWQFEGKKYALLPQKCDDTVYFFAEGCGGKVYPGVDEIIDAGYDLLAMLIDNPMLDVF